MKTLTTSTRIRPRMKYQWMRFLDRFIETEIVVFDSKGNAIEPTEIRYTHGQVNADFVVGAFTEDSDD